MKKEFDQLLWAIEERIRDPAVSISEEIALLELSVLDALHGLD